MSTLAEDRQDEPFDPRTWKHQFLLLKSQHCCRPVLYQGVRRFIQCVSANCSGCDIVMTVYLRGIQGGIDSSQIQIDVVTEQRGTP